MDLRATQKPLKERYREDPSASRITLAARGSQTDVPITCSVDIGRATYEAQAHGGVGGPGTGACSGDLLLGALAACAQLTCQMVATSMGIPFRSHRGARRGRPRPARHTRRGQVGGRGFEAIRLRFEVDAPEATAEQLESLHEKTERYCTVLQTLRVAAARDRDRRAE